LLTTLQEAECQPCKPAALDAVWYNFVKMHKTLRITPAMAAGVTDETPARRITCRCGEHRSLKADIEATAFVVVINHEIAAEKLKSRGASRTV